MVVPFEEKVVVRKCWCGTDGTMLLTDGHSILACGNNEQNKLALNQRQGFLMSMKNMFNKVSTSFRTHILTYMQSYIHTHVHVCGCYIHTNRHTHTYTNSCIHTFICAHVHIHTCTYIHYAHINSLTYIHKSIHTYRHCAHILHIHARVGTI